MEILAFKCKNYIFNICFKIFPGNEGGKAGIIRGTVFYLYLDFKQIPDNRR
jgi:hypothetical protein